MGGRVKKFGRNKYRSIRPTPPPISYSNSPEKIVTRVLRVLLPRGGREVSPQENRVVTAVSYGDSFEWVGWKVVLGKNIVKIYLPHLKKGERGIKGGVTRGGEGEQRHKLGFARKPNPLKKVKHRPSN